MQTSSKWCDIKKINKDNNLFVPSGKTTNFYHVKPEQYQRLLDFNITKTYKKAPPNNTSKIIEEEKKTAQKVKPDDG